jgi:hypothetical protein
MRSGKAELGIKLSTKLHTLNEFYSETHAARHQNLMEGRKFSFIPDKMPAIKQIFNFPLK